MSLGRTSLHGQGVIDEVLQDGGEESGTRKKELGGVGVLMLCPKSSTFGTDGFMEKVGEGVGLDVAEAVESLCGRCGGKRAGRGRWLTKKKIVME